MSIFRSQLERAVNRRVAVDAMGGRDRRHGRLPIASECKQPEVNHTFPECVPGAEDTRVRF
jgi:hypothetical protein